VSAQIIQFAPRARPTPLPAIDLWVDEVDEIGPFPNPVQAHWLLVRCPDPAHPVAKWLAAFDRHPPAAAA
jgi:hypothetical protein